jgi:sulfite dehydrogenase (quinone) subunit SoeA
MNLGERVRDYLSPRHRVETSAGVADEVKCTTCYMCPAAVGSKFISRTAICYIECNRDHPVNRGVICGKGASGIMQQYSPAKLKKPLRLLGELALVSFAKLSGRKPSQPPSSGRRRSVTATRKNLPSSPATTRACR